MVKRVRLTRTALLLALSVPASSALSAGQVSPRATASIVEAGSVTLVNAAPLQAALVTGSLSNTGVTLSTGGQDIGGNASLAMPGFVSGGGEAVAISGSSLITGTTINGEALSVSVGGTFDAVSGGGNTAANGGTTVVIAQYN